MDIGKAFKYMFDDKDWLKKIAIGGVLNIIPIVNFIPVGYGLRQFKQVAAGTDVPLVEWDDWGGDFMRGLMVFLGTLVYSLPIILLQIISAIITAIAGSSGTGEASGFAALCITAVSCLVGLYGIAMGVWLPAAIVRYVQEDQFGAFFQFSEIWAFIKNNLSNYIVVILLIIAASIVASVVGGIACGIGVLFTTFWATLVMAHLLGQLVGGTPAAAGSNFDSGDMGAPQM